MDLMAQYTLYTYIGAISSSGSILRLIGLDNVFSYHLYQIYYFKNFILFQKNPLVTKYSNIVITTIECNYLQHGLLYQGHLSIFITLTKYWPKIFLMIFEFLKYNSYMSINNDIGNHQVLWLNYKLLHAEIVLKHKTHYAN